MIIHTILFVADQEKSTAFYEGLFQISSRLNVPGMTEISLSERHILGLMPAKGIKRLLGQKIAEPQFIPIMPKAELYLRLKNPEEFFTRALKLGAIELSPMQPRDWGHRAAYVFDLDSHVLAFSD